MLGKPLFKYLNYYYGNAWPTKQLYDKKMHELQERMQMQIFQSFLSKHREVGSCGRYFMSASI